MKLVWHQEGLQERDWIRLVLDGLISKEIVDLEQSIVTGDAAHVVSSNRAPLESYRRYFEACRAQSQDGKLVLIHLSDEWFSGGYSVYGLFDHVIRNYSTWLARNPGIMTIPLGYPNATTPGEVAVAADRTLVWSFLGEMKASRLEMARSLSTLQPHRAFGIAPVAGQSRPQFSKSEFDAVLGDSIFAPCPMGNVVLETWRLYESLERGCIPIIEKRPALDYFSSLFGEDHPIPAFSSWTSARRFIEAACRDRAWINQKQSDIHLWWSRSKVDVWRRISDALRGPTARAQLQDFARLSRNQIPLLHEPLRLSELVRHQTVDSARSRLLRSKGPLRQIFRESLHR